MKRFPTKHLFPGLDMFKTGQGLREPEDPVLCHFGVDKAAAGADDTRYTFAVLQRLTVAVAQRLGLPKEMFLKCVVCGLDWGRCEHAGNNYVCIDSEDMRLLYEKLDMPVPEYPC